MSYSITRADAYSISYDNIPPDGDGMPVARARIKTSTRLGTDGVGVTVTGSGGQRFTLKIESFFSTYAAAVAWGVTVGLLKEGLVTIVTPRGTFAGCVIEDMAAPEVISGIPSSRCTISMSGRCP